jgi:hypothetical protein
MSVSRLLFFEKSGKKVEKDDNFEAIKRKNHQKTA